MVVRYASLVASLGASLIAHKQHHLICTSPPSLCVSASGADGAARDEHEMGVKTDDLDSSSLIMLCSNHRTKPCGMLITYAHHV